jgi:TolB-like protein/Tfp pilus assembly protein PilF
MANLLEELKRRNVVRVGIAYLVAAWLVLQVIDLVVENTSAPPWVMQIFLVVTALGFPIVLVFAWAFEITPEGVKRERDVDRSQSITHNTGRKLDRVIIIVLVVAVGLLLTDKFLASDAGLPEQSARTEIAEPATREETGEPTTQASRRSIAVLPFVNRSRSEDDEFFVDGIHDDILTQLAKISSLKIISRTSVMQYRDTEKSMRAIGEELDVATIMEGSVQRAGERVRINVQLIDANTDEHLWAEVYDRALTASNIFEIQTEMAIAIAGALQANLRNDEQQRLTQKPTENLAAYEAYLLGKQRMAFRTTQSIADAKVYFERAIELDPEFALAYVGISDTIQLQVDYSGWSPESVAAEAMPYIERAMELDGDSGEAFISLASTYEFAGEIDAADDAYKRGLELLPNNAQGHMWYGLYLLNTRGLMVEALEQFELASIHDPLSVIVQNNLGFALSGMGKFGESEAAINKAFEINPVFMTNFQYRAYKYWKIDARLVLAMDWLWRTLELDVDNPLNYAAIAEIFMDLGDLDRARCWLDRGIEINPDAGPVFSSFAEFGALRDDRRLAIEYGRRTPPNTYARYYWSIPLSAAKIYLMQDGDLAEALALYEEFFPELLGEAAKMNRTNFLAAVDVAEILLQTGEVDRAHQLLETVESYIADLPRLGDYGQMVTDARIHSLRGDNELALEKLQQAVDGGWRNHWRFFLDVDTAFEPLRSLPEFDAIYREIAADMASQLERVIAAETLETSCAVNLVRQDQQFIANGLSRESEFVRK